MLPDETVCKVSVDNVCLHAWPGRHTSSSFWTALPCGTAPGPLGLLSGWTPLPGLLATLPALNPGRPQAQQAQQAQQAAQAAQRAAKQAGKSASTICEHMCYHSSTARTASAAGSAGTSSIAGIAANEAGRHVKQRMQTYLEQASMDLRASLGADKARHFAAVPAIHLCSLVKQAHLQHNKQLCRFACWLCMPGIHIRHLLQPFLVRSKI